ESQGSVINDAGGRPSKVVVVSRDITERIRQMEALQKTLAELHAAHEELKAAQMQLIQSEKLEAVSTFAGGIAHEVKNPLQTITLGVDFLKNSLGNAGADVQMVLNEMDNAVRRADAVIRGMAEFSSYNKRDVKDHDPGVIESKLADKSERAYATEMIRKGVLDLMVLKKVVELYGGMIRIINRKEGGVKVTLMFKAQRKE